MPCCDAMTKKIITIGPDATVSEAIDALYKNNIRSIPVIDDNKKLLGVFSFSNLLKKLLPISVTLDEETIHGLDMNISLEPFTSASPWVAKRLKDRLSQKVSDLMVKNTVTVHPDTPLGEGIRLIVEHGSPLMVVCQDTDELLGVISSQNLLHTIQEFATKLDKGEEIKE